VGRDPAQAGVIPRGPRGGMTKRRTDRPAPLFPID
jgi:hypothetical protein